MSEYLNKQCYVTKSKKATQVKPHEYSTSSEDLFLPTLRKPNLTDLLIDENYLQISYDESVQEMSDSDNDSDDSEKGQEIDLNIEQLNL